MRFKAKILIELGALLALTPLARTTPALASTGNHGDPATTKPRFSSKVEGFISELTLSANGKRILIAQIPDREADLTAGTPMLSFYDSSGKRLWTQPTKPVRTQALAPDGSLALISTHEDRLIALNARGKELWSIASTCKPLILWSEKKILCYHDEDAESHVAFDILDLKGKKRLSYPVERDVLTLKLSPDQRNVAMGLTRGQVVLLRPDFSVRWQRQLKGEIVDLSIGPGKRPRLAVLHDSMEKKERLLSVFDSRGQLLSETPVLPDMNQVALPPGSEQLLVHGTRAGAKVLAAYEGTTAKWTRTSESFARYSPAFMANRDSIVISYDDINDPDRHSHILALKPDGSIRTDLPILSSKGAYLYLWDYAPSAGVLAVATDDSEVRSYRVRSR